MDPDVSAELTANGNYAIKLSREDYELNVSIPPAEVSRIHEVPTARWERRQSMRIGESAGSPVWWSCGEDRQVYISVGHDDETWDFGINFGAGLIDVISSAIDDAKRA